MANIRIPNILTDLAHVGAAGLLQGGAPIIQKELEICRQWGYILEYKDDRVILKFDEDQIVPYWIQRETPNLAWEGLRVNGFLTIDSTNREALEQARAGAPGGTLICAEEQTAGKGREDREWFSPAKSGLYFSLILRPGQAEKYWPLLTHVASVALVRTLQELYDTRRIPHPLAMDIKWPNDVLISRKKCAGILLQTLHENANAAVVVGVGINVHRGSVPQGMEEEAVCIDEAAHTVVPRRMILVWFLKHFQIVYSSFEHGGHKEVLESWKHHSHMWNGVPVWIEQGADRRTAVTRGIDDSGALLVETEEGAIETILSGSVRVRRAG